MLAWALWTLAILGLIPIGWFDELLRQAGRPELVQLNASAITFVVAILSASTVGAVLASRRPRHPVGWLLLALGLSVTIDGVASGYASYGALARPGALPAAAGWPCTPRWVCCGRGCGSASCCCSPRPGRCRRLAGAGGPGWPRSRRRVQDLVDRRFNRRRYDATRTIQTFSGRLRQQTDLDTLTAELPSVVDQTMQPAWVSLWLRPDGRRRPGVERVDLALGQRGAGDEFARRRSSEGVTGGPTTRE